MNPSAWNMACAQDYPRHPARKQDVSEYASSITTLPQGELNLTPQSGPREEPKPHFHFLLLPTLPSPLVPPLHPPPPPPPSQNMADEQQQPTNASTPSTTTLTNAASNLPAQPTSEPKKAIKIEQADVNFLVRFPHPNCLSPRDSLLPLNVRRTHGKPRANAAPRIQVSELDVSKARAGDMLRASGGDRKAAVSAFVVG